MQLGTRWRADEQTPASVPDALRREIAEVERRTGGSGHWTLTWLEGRPIAELDAGWEVLLTAEGEVLSRPFQD